MHYILTIENNIVTRKFKSNHPPTAPNAILVDEATWNSVEVGMEKTDDGFVYPDNLIQAKKDALKTSVYQKRKQLENSGITIHTSQGDYIVDTSQIGRSNLQGTILTYEIGNLDKTSDTVPWKFENGFLELNYDQLKEISAFVTDYIEKLFLAEKQHYDAIEQLTTIEEIQNYDLDQFWPSNEYNASF